MIWAILVLVGVPLWLCAIGILALVFRNRGLRRRPGNVPVRVLRAGRKRWTRGHGVWVSDVFAWRGSPAAWREELAHVVTATARGADRDERKALHRLGEDPVIAAFLTAEGAALTVAAAREQRSTLLGPFAVATDEPAHPPLAGGQV